MFKEFNFPLNASGEEEILMPVRMKEIAQTFAEGSIFDLPPNMAMTGTVRLVEQIFTESDLLKPMRLDEFYAYQAGEMAELQIEEWLCDSSRLDNYDFVLKQIHSEIAWRLSMCTTSEWELVEESVDWQKWFLDKPQEAAHSIHGVVFKLLEDKRNEAELSARTPKVVDLSTLKAGNRDFEGKRIVWCSGKFELGHAGHSDLITQARRLAGPDGLVVVTVDSDKLVKLFSSRPQIEIVEERIGRLLSNRKIDMIAAFDFLGSNETEIGQAISRFQHSFQPHYRLIGDREHARFKLFEADAINAGTWLLYRQSEAQELSTTLMFKRIAALMRHGS